MPQIPTARFLVLAITLLASAACRQQQPPAPAAAATPAAPAAAGAPAAPTTAAATTPQPAAGDAAPAAPAASQPPAVDVCSLLSAAEVSAAMGKTLVKGQGGCDYGLDPSAKEKQFAANQAKLAHATKRAAAGDMSAFMKGMAQGGANNPLTGGSAIMEQMTISLNATRDDQTEEAIKAIYTKTGETVRGALAPEKRGLNGVIQGLDEISGVGDWAFATNVASVNMGMGFSIRGRLLEARKGPWHATISATVAPDPGVAALDGHLADLARAFLAKL
jgi:hypothetical protein